MAIGFKLHGSPLLSPSIRPSSNNSQNGGGSPAPSPYLLPRSPAMRASSRPTNTSSGPGSSGSRTSKLRSPHVSSSSPLANPKSPALKPGASPYLSASSAGSPQVTRPPQQALLPPVKMDFRIESPPLLMIGTHSESTGSLLSGLFTLHVNAPHGIALKSVHIAVLQDVCLNVPNSPATSANPPPPAVHSHGSAPGSPSLNPTSVPPSPAITAAPITPPGLPQTAKIAPASPSTAWADPPHFHHLFPASCLGCADCLTRTTELARWNVLATPNTLPKGAHAYPFSHLIPGSVPATCYDPLFTVRYRLVAVAIPDVQPGSVPASPLIVSSPHLGPATSTAPRSPALLPKSPSSLLAKSPAMPPVSPLQSPASSPYPANSASALGVAAVSSEPYIHELPLDIKRAIVRGPDRNSIRVFPPTELVAHLTMPNIVYPESNFIIELVLDGITVRPEGQLRKTRWRMRKINWRIDEACKFVVARCPEHIYDKIPRKGRAMSNTLKAAAKKEPAGGGLAGSGTGTQAAAINNGGSTNLGGTTTGMAAPTPDRHHDRLGSRRESSRHHAPAATLMPGQGSNAGSPSLNPFVTGPPHVSTPAAPQAAVTISRSSPLAGIASSPSVAAPSPLGRNPGNLISSDNVSAPSPLHLPHGPQHNLHSPISSPRIGPIGTVGSIGHHSGFDNGSAILSEPSSSAEPSPALRATTQGAAAVAAAANAREHRGSGADAQALEQALLQAGGAPQGPKVGERPGDITIEHTRTVGMGEIKNDFKTDFSGKGKIEVMAEIDTHQLNRVSCNLTDPEFGMSIGHTLVLEMVVAEEVAPSKGHYQAISTGAARVLRMQFSLNVTQRPGLGIAWDDEVPPKYSDVPTSPPQYEQVSGHPNIEDLVLGHEEEYVGGIHARLEPTQREGIPNGGPVNVMVVTSGIQTPTSGPASRSSSIYRGFSGTGAMTPSGLQYEQMSLTTSESSCTPRTSSDSGASK